MPSLTAIATRLAGALAGALATVALHAPPALSVTVAQHRLPGPQSPALALAASPTGLLVSRLEGQARAVLQRLTTTPQLTLAATVPVEPLTLGTGPDGDAWIVAGEALRGSAAPLLALDDLLPGGPIVQRSRFHVALGPADWPEAFAAGPDGSVWIADMTAETIERLMPGGGTQTYELPDAGAPTSIVAAPDGSVWFTETVRGAIGEITADGRLVERPIPGAGFGGFGTSEPYSIALGADGAAWFTEENAGSIGRIDASGTIEQFPIPDTSGVPRGDYGSPMPRYITLGPDGAMWFTDGGDEEIGRITPAGAISEYPIGTAGEVSPEQITAYAGQLWFAEAGVTALGSVDPTGVPGTPQPAAATRSAVTGRRQPRRACAEVRSRRGSRGRRPSPRTCRSARRTTAAARTPGSRRGPDPRAPLERVRTLP
jgi:virginiamycin B lyase